MNTHKCKTCKHWEDYECSSGKIREPRYSDYEEQNTDSVIYGYQEGGGFSVGPDFGCVHWTPKEES